VKTFIALLRGINVGKAKRIPMADLRELLMELGYSGVVTLLNSGNAVFRASTGAPAKHATDITEAIKSRLSIDVPVIVKSARDLTAIVAENPLVNRGGDDSRLLVAFVQHKKTLPALAAIGHLAVPPEQFAMGKHAAYLNCANGILKSKAGSALIGKAGTLVTTRNWATVLKLQALAGAAGV
jgi:uncharacterized protein (DUF1697 family)